MRKEAQGLEDLCWNWALWYVCFWSSEWTITILQDESGKHVSVSHSLQTTSNDTALQKPIQQQGLNSSMATKATFRGKAIAVGDMFLAPTPGCIKSLSSNNAGSVTITLEKVQLLSKKIGSSTWKKTSDEIVVNILGSSPSFWSWDNNECLCLH